VSRFFFEYPYDAVTACEKSKRTEASHSQGNSAQALLTHTSCVTHVLLEFHTRKADVSRRSSAMCTSTRIFLLVEFSSNEAFFQSPAASAIFVTILRINLVRGSNVHNKRSVLIEYFTFRSLVSLAVCGPRSRLSIAAAPAADQTSRDI
jgi:hypothetical protein